MSKEVKILVVGDPIVDRYWYCTPKGISPEAPILTWNVDRVVDKPGGAANVVNNLCGLTNIYDHNVDINFVAWGSSELRVCVPSNFPTKGLFITGKKSVIKNRIIFKNPHQQIIRFDQDENISREHYFESEIINRIRSNTFNVGIVSDYLHGEVTRDIIKAVRQSCDLVICDPKGYDPSKYSSLVDILTPNLTELNNLTPAGINSILDNVANLGTTIQGSRKDPVVIVLKRGEGGCTLYQENIKVRHYKPYRTKRVVIDPTGAGDTFIAALAYKTAIGEKLEEAVDYSNWLAGISVTYPNCWVPTVEECVRRL